MCFRDFDISIDYSDEIKRDVKEYWGENEEYGLALIGSPELMIELSKRVEECERVLDPTEQSLALYQSPDVAAAIRVHVETYEKTFTLLAQMRRLLVAVKDEIIAALDSFDSDALVGLLRAKYGHD